MSTPGFHFSDPASSSLSRDEVHFRQMEMRGYRRNDGLFEVEGRVVDRKPQRFKPSIESREFAANEPIHDIGVRILLDRELVVQAVRTFTAAAPYGECPMGGRALQSLVGTRIGPGWGKEVRSALGGARSCTHLMELLMPLATTAIQSIGPLLGPSNEAIAGEGRPGKIDSCYAYRSQGELVRIRWPEHHRPRPRDESTDKP